MAQRRLAENPPDIRSNNSPTAPRRLKALERRRYVVSLRTAGATLKQCADKALEKFGEENLPKKYTSREVWRDIERAQKAAYKGIAKDLNIFRMIQVDRYESVVRAHWLRAMMGDKGATDRVLKAMKDENKLLGLDAPAQVDMRVLQIDARIDQLLETVASGAERETAPALGSGSDQGEDATVEGTARYL